MAQLKEQSRLIARVSIRHEDELSQMPERDFVLIFEPVDTKTHPTAQDMLGLRFRMALIWKEKRDVGEVELQLTCRVLHNLKAWRLHGTNTD